MHTTKRFKQHLLCAMLAVGLLVPCFGAGAETVVKDRATGTSVLIVDQADKSLVTNLETGESVEIDGNYEWMTSADYSRLMKNDRIERAAREAAMAIRRSLTEDDTRFQKSGSILHRFSINQSWYTPAFYMDSTSATVSIDQDYNYANIYVDMIREISFWPDKKYGKKTFYPSYDVRTWTGLQANANYYLEISKTYNGQWTPGYWGVTW